MEPLPTPTSSTIELAWHHAEDELLAAIERDERPLARLDGGLADLAARRVGVELLNGAPEEDQELVHRRRIREPWHRGRRLVLDRRTASQPQQDGRGSTLSVGHQKCNRLRVLEQTRLIVLACRYANERK